ncbi:MAG: hypothetical protein WA642_09245, partial [Steroidobacteraceae bacterium]
TLPFARAFPIRFWRGSINHSTARCSRFVNVSLFDRSTGIRRAWDLAKKPAFDNETFPEE